MGVTWLSVGVLASAGIYVADAIGIWNELMGICGITLSWIARSTMHLSSHVPGLRTMLGTTGTGAEHRSRLT
jgi:hypothetical protein